MIGHHAAAMRETRWSAAMIAARAGDRRTYGDLLTAIAGRVRRYAGARVTRLGAGPHEIEDIVQDVLTAIHAKRDTWEPSRPIGPWVDAIIRYKTVDALRRIGKRQAMTSDSFDLVVETVAAPAQARPVAATEMHNRIATLPSRERGVVAALGIDGMTIAGCAERFGISEGAVRVAFHRGLARLASLAESEPGQETAVAGSTGPGGQGRGR
ncbi:MAG: sigma factor-like helix-turn-helix DNA-binding protein [Pseudomonadota bacterium]